MKHSDLHTLECIDIDGVRHEFYARIIKDAVVASDGSVINAWQYFIYDNNAPEYTEEFFDAEFVEVDSQTILSRAMSHKNIERYTKKGIPEAVIRDASSRLGKAVVSSSNIEYLLDETESRTASATRVWERLVAAGLATYDHAKDRYKLADNSTVPRGGCLRAAMP
jgi:hypothetical protein